MTIRSKMPAELLAVIEVSNLRLKSRPGDRYCPFLYWSVSLFLDTNQGNLICHRILASRTRQSLPANLDRLDRLRLHQRLFGGLSVAGSAFVRLRSFELEALIDQTRDLAPCLQPTVQAVNLIEVLSLVVLDDLVLLEINSAGALTVQGRYDVGFRGLWRQHID